MFSTYLVDKSWVFGRLKISFSVRSSKSPLGRFGAGWNWKIGFQSGGRTVLLSLLIAELVISLEKGELCKSS